ncbi:MAG: methylenetetrahydrofolate--tRNA-(uracil(54)-C(5))-methyltransferase (FADH(2)-oxidizing) TrmFO [Candidatus Coatesbacteria bacterium]|nr:methylenetetrahydrofolate--tRNA-(uracil(54)-C(5))-methyltransferase (FADH(2)-oxidizing) TrmFO [Candidatus Coatesbacteria bacterium]
MTPVPDSEIVRVVGGGLAGCEAAWQLARGGCRVRLYEMRPGVSTGAHRGAGLAELVCSNSFKGRAPHQARGLLKAEGVTLGSLLLELAAECSVPAGAALAVDRDRFSAAVEAALNAESAIEIVRREVCDWPAAPLLLATGPLTSPALSAVLRRELGGRRLFFHDATAPVVTAASLDRRTVFAAGRHGRDSDYLNVGLRREQYEEFHRRLLSLPRAPIQGVDARAEADGLSLFEACLPLEVLAERSADALRFGPLRPVGLRRPDTGESYYAVIQLRAEDRAATRYNLVGCQTRLTPPAQRELFRSLPGLEGVEFVRYGRMHRNSYLDGPRLLKPTLELFDRPGCFVAGQLSGSEGYGEAVLTGLLAGRNLARRLRGLPPLEPPATTMLGALVRTLSGRGLRPSTVPAPVNANFGLLPPTTARTRGRRGRRLGRAQRALAACRVFAWRLATAY